MITLDFQTLEEELITYGAMTENEATDFYNVENKAEALQYILDYWQDSISEITDEEIAEEKAYRDMIMFDRY